MPYERRDKLPPGITLVLFAECGTPIRLQDGFESMIRDPAFLEELQDPATHKNTIEANTGMNIQIYNPGDLYPNLRWHHIAEYTWYEIYKILGPSGLHQIPMNSDSSDEWDYYDDTSLVHKTLGIIIPDTSLVRYYKIKPKSERFTDEEIIDSYEHSLVPYPQKIREVYALNPAETMQKLKRSFSIRTLFDNRGPGIYYWKVCRASNQPGRIEDPTSGKIYSHRIMRRELHRKEMSRTGGRRRRRKTQRRLPKNHTRKNRNRNVY